MKNLKKLVATAALMGIIIIGVTDANAGMLMSDLTGDSQPQACTEVKADKSDSWDFGIIVSGFGIIVSGLMGDAPTECGILMSD